jgi:hypothetical protein
LALKDQNTAEHFTAEGRMDGYFIHPKPDDRYNKKMGKGDMQILDTTFM